MFSGSTNETLEGPFRIVVECGEENGSTTRLALSGEAHRILIDRIMQSFGVKQVEDDHAAQNATVLSDQIIQAAQDAKTIVRNRMEQLSPREREVLDHLYAGLSNKQIAYALKISPRTVEVHRASIMRKMNVRSVAMLVRTASMAA